MYKNKKILAFVPARIGSKRLKNKNILKINGIPLYEHSIKVTKNSKYIDSIIVSTDSQDILNKAHQLGCIKNNLRPEELSGDSSRTIDVILYELKENNLNNYDALVLLQPTSPNRTVDLLDKAIEKYFETETSLITIVKKKTDPLFFRVIKNNELQKIDSLDLNNHLKSNDIYQIVGNIYINNIKNLSTETVLNDNKIPFLIDESYNIDIDTKEDLEKAKAIMSKSTNNYD